MGDFSAHLIDRFAHWQCGLNSSSKDSKLIIPSSFGGCKVRGFLFTVNARSKILMVDFDAIRNARSYNFARIGCFFALEISVAAVYGRSSIRTTSSIANVRLKTSRYLMHSSTINMGLDIAF